MKTLVKQAHGHDVIAHQLDDTDRAQAVADLIARLLPTITAGIHAADDLTLTHELERYEGLPKSALVDRMRQVVADEQAGRREAVTSRG